MYKDSEWALMTHFWLCETEKLNQFLAGPPARINITPAISYDANG